ncbi:transcription termination factor 4, mitochondrial isoform X1 [Pantherophis guttatus]|uniref:Transcription termination factor 4, mitochondrial isoform X1 n=1 Tax=Pantherophis guttatus TaxID=94885 RepID=A0A6P9DWE0_PANGU|nr:transcription termination factor 4, mitochondrial isoform X1 [Pantherophis guttatus]
MPNVKLAIRYWRIFQKCSFPPLAYDCIHLPSLSVLPAAFWWSHQHLDCRLITTRSFVQSKKGFPPYRSNYECTLKPQETLINAPVEEVKATDVDHLKIEEDTSAYVDLGFSPAQITQLLSLQLDVPFQSKLTAISELLLLGLSITTILKTLEKKPELLRMSPKHLKERANLLRRLDLDAGSVNQVAVHFPSIFTVPHKRIKSLENLLKEKCLFTMAQVSKILRTTPQLLLEELNDVEYKFQFAYFRMGIKHGEIVQSGFFQASLAEINKRINFLERLGRYQTPDKKGQTQIINPKLKSIIRASEQDFVTEIACSSIEEYEVFKKLLADEEEQRRQQEEAMEEFSDSENDDGSGSE